jgi:outer membrane protein
MKNASIFLSTLSLIGVIILFVMFANKNKTNNSGSSVNVPTVPAGSMKIAYVDIDSLEANYELLKVKREEFKTRQDQMEGELQKSYQQMQADAEEVQKKAQANNLTQDEYQASQKRLMQMQQSLESRKQALTDQLMKDQEDFNNALKARLDSFLTDYNKDKNYDYILSYSGAASAILHANHKWNITADVIKGMNAISPAGGADKKNK